MLLGIVSHYTAISAAYSMYVQLAYASIFKTVFHNAECLNQIYIFNMVKEPAVKFLTRYLCNSNCTSFQDDSWMLIPFHMFI